MSEDNFIKATRSQGEDISAETEGLQALSQQLMAHNIQELSIPAIVSQTNTELHLEKIEGTGPTEEQWRQLGIGLAKLHCIKFQHYGWAKDNFIGRSPQLNGFATGWGEFFINRRLQTQISFIKNQAIAQRFQQQLDQVKTKLAAFLK